MPTLRAGSKHARSFVRALRNALVVPLNDFEHAHFCIKRWWRPDTQSEHVEAHLDIHLREAAAGEPPSEVDIFVDDARAELTYVGRGRIAMHSARERQYLLPELPAELDCLLRPSEPATMDGSSLAESLATTRGASERHALAERLAASWLGPLPSVAPPAASDRAPASIRRWHALWAQLDEFHDHPWCCWPAVWIEDPSGISFFQSEWQNGGTFGVRDGAVWIGAWISGSESICAQDLGELALQFLIFGLTEGANGYFLFLDSARARALGVRDLGLRRWTGWFGGDMDFVGGDGCLGTSDGESVLLRATDRHSMLRLLQSASSMGAPRPP